MLALALETQPARGDKLALEAFAVLVGAAQERVQAARADEGAVGALVGEGGQQRAQKLGVGRDERILQESRGKAGVVVSFRGDADANGCVALCGRRAGRLRLSRMGCPGGLGTDSH